MSLASAGSARMIAASAALCSKRRQIRTTWTRQLRLILLSALITAAPVPTELLVLIVLLAV